MANTRDITLALKNDRQLRKALEKLGKESRQRKVIRRALSKASTPVNKEAKARAPQRTKQLRKSIGKVTRQYKTSGTVLVVIGPRTGHAITVNGEKVNPIKYAHLVEFGHGGPRPAPPKPFLRPAYDAKSGQAQRIFNDEAWNEVRKEAARVAAKGK